MVADPILLFGGNICVCRLLGPAARGAGVCSRVDVGQLEIYLVDLDDVVRGVVPNICTGARDGGECVATHVSSPLLFAPRECIRRRLLFVLVSLLCYDPRYAAHRFVACVCVLPAPTWSTVRITGGLLQNPVLMIVVSARLQHW